MTPQSISQIMKNQALGDSGPQVNPGKVPSGLKEAPEPYFSLILTPFAARFKRFCCDFVYDFF